MNSLLNIGDGSPVAFGAAGKRQWEAATMPAGRRFSHFPFIIGALIPCCAQIGNNSVPLLFSTEPDNSGHYWNVPNFAMDQFADKDDLRWLCRFKECCEQGGIALRLNTAVPLTANSWHS